MAGDAAGAREERYVSERGVPVSVRRFRMDNYPYDYVRVCYGVGDNSFCMHTPCLPEHTIENRQTLFFFLHDHDFEGRPFPTHAQHHAQIDTPEGQGS